MTLKWVWKCHVFLWNGFILIKRIWVVLVKKYKKGVPIEIHQSMNDISKVNLSSDSRVLNSKTPDSNISYPSKHCWFTEKSKQSRWKCLLCLNDTYRMWEYVHLAPMKTAKKLHFPFDIWVLCFCLRYFRFQSFVPFPLDPPHFKSTLNHFMPLFRHHLV